MKIKYNIIFLFMAALSVSSCWVPIFDEKISTAALLGNKMTRIPDIGPIVMSYNDFQKTNFVPTWEINPSDGFLLREEGMSTNLSFLYFDTNSNMYTKSSGNFFNNPSTAKMPARAGPMIGLDPSIIVTSYNIGPPADDEAQMYRYMRSLPGSVLTPLTPHLLPPALAIGTTIDSVTGDIYIGCLWGTFSSPSVQRYLCSVSGVLFSSPFNSTVSFPGSSTIGFCAAPSSIVGEDFYTSFGTSLEGSTYKAPFSPIFTATQLTGITRRITDRLTNNMFLAQDDTTLTVYDSVGKERFTVNNGNLRFVHEVWDPAMVKWIMVFVLPVYSGNSERGDVTYRIYQIPTDQLNSF